MSTYNHAFSLGFSVKNSDYEDWDECVKKEKPLVIKALLERIDMLMNDDTEYQEAMDGFDTYKEEEK
jgi:hypothetical protein